MRYAIISDIHGNLHALEAVIEDLKIQSPDSIICLGDMVGYGAFPNDVIDLVRSTCDQIVVGNHDHAAVGLADIGAFNQYAYNAAIWTFENLTADNINYLKNLPFTFLKDYLFFVHASPLNPGKWHYIFSDLDAEFAMEHSPAPIAFVGHTHIPKDHQTNRGRLINVGSVGQPRDGDPRAAYTIFDETSGQRTLVRVEYDVKSAGKAIIDAGLPNFLAERLAAGR